MIAGTSVSSSAARLWYTSICCGSWVVVCLPSPRSAGVSGSGAAPTTAYGSSAVTGALSRCAAIFGCSTAMRSATTVTGG
jgi:hypothetical protein